MSRQARNLSDLSFHDSKLGKVTLCVAWDTALASISKTSYAPHCYYCCRTFAIGLLKPTWYTSLFRVSKSCTDKCMSQASLGGCTSAGSIVVWGCDLRPEGRLKDAKALAHLECNARRPERSRHTQARDCFACVVECRGYVRDQ